jgi:hypothetical protein
VCWWQTCGSDSSSCVLLRSASAATAFTLYSMLCNAACTVCFFMSFVAYRREMRRRPATVNASNVVTADLSGVEMVMAGCGPVTLPEAPTRSLRRHDSLSGQTLAVDNPVAAKLV